MPAFVVCLAALAIAVGYTFSKGLGVNNARLPRVPPARSQLFTVTDQPWGPPWMLRGLMTIRI